MFIMKTELLISLLCVSLSVSAAAVVPVEEVVPEVRAGVSVPGEVVVQEQTEDQLKEISLQFEGRPPSTREKGVSNCPPGWRGHRDNCFRLINLTYTWNNAEFLCENLGASLASVHNLEEYNFLKRLVWRAGYITAWLGGYRFENHWKWDDGTPFDYNNWYTTSSSGYYCLQLNSQGDLGWSGKTCSEGHPFICSFNKYC